MDKRRYSTTLRAEQAALTRRRVLDAAARQFTDHGYLGTTLAGIAKAAGVSVQTVYNVVGGKSAVLKAVYDTVLAGDDEPVPMAQRPLFRAMIEAPTGRECLTHYAAIARLLNERVMSLLTMALAQAATGDAELRAFTDTIEGERAIGTRTLARHLAEHFGLREGMEPDTAADVIWALTAPELAHRLVADRGWSWDRYQHWLTTTITDGLLGSENATEPG
ncbi:TetR/AcrR family transcriptional regulator [Actinomadura opuntiae]|uniref:TetR/AcrR family transcriptional regulator n=1 Tax=Actinomadura sp. OS1-43 TaxID=604315 RepID=UPI00255B13AE|nr:TetR/AcrR family transcriptional regulator [Actinomadura sp. OS1-43]MDL4814015.1 TetR/AcrR family transcriptional regulator [Actinomadura sp. OS1-43]